MSVLVYGLNYKSAPIDLLERVTVAGEDLPKALASLIRRTHVTEAAVLSTCNRVEAYAHVSRYHGGVADLRDFFSEWAGVAPEDLAEHSYDYYGEGAAGHLFKVACGLDSMVVGERQIHLQVRDALANATAEQVAGRTLQTLFRRALHVGRRARSETGLSNGGASMVDVGLEAAARKLGRLDGRVALIVGAGAMGGMAARRLQGLASRILIANRSPERAERLAERVGGEVVEFGDLSGGLRDADFAVCSTGATRPVLTPDLVGGVMERRAGTPLALVDLAVPRDVHPDCAEVPGVTLLGIDVVRALAAEGPTGVEVAKAQRLVAEEVERFAAWNSRRAVEPTIAALRRRAEDIRSAELARRAGRFADLSERERSALESLTKAIVNTLLHEPSVRLKDMAEARGEERYADALRELFDLPLDDE